MNYDSNCPECGEWVINPSHHKCLRKWLCWCPEDGEDISDSRIMRAADAGGAAEQLAEIDDRDSAEYCIVTGDSSCEVWVCLEKDYTALVDECVPMRIISRFAVTGETRRMYIARSLKLGSDR